MAVLKSDLKESFDQLAALLNLNIAGLKEDTNEKCKALTDGVTKLHERVLKLKKPTKTYVRNLNYVQSSGCKAKAKASSSHLKAAPSTASSRPSPPKVSSNPTPSTTTSKAQVKIAPKEQAPPTLTNLPKNSTESQPKQKSIFMSKPKVLYVGDSVGHTASMQQVEEGNFCRMKTARAYSSVYNKEARWPKYNFTDIVKYALDNPGREKFDMLVMSAPTVDITNIDTSNVAQKDIYQQKVITSCNNMFNIAQKSLDQNPNLTKVVIMEHIPRFDSPEMTHPH
jgi:hypothetical protein